MVMEVGTDDALLEYANWLIESGVWDGRVVSWKEGPALEAEFSEKFLALSSEFEEIAAQFAWIGATETERPLIERAIEELRVTRDGGVIQVGLGKSLSRIWRHHKKEILIGIGVAVVIAAVVVVAVCTGGAGGGAAAAGGAALLDGLAEGDEGKERPAASGGSSSPSNGEGSSPVQSNGESQTAPINTGNNQHTETSTQNNWNHPIEFQEHGVTIGGSFMPYSEAFKELQKQNILSGSQSANSQASPSNQETAPQSQPGAPSQGVGIQENRSFLYKFFQDVGRGLSDPELFDPNAPLPESNNAPLIDKVAEGAYQFLQDVGKELSDPELLDPNAPLPASNDTPLIDKVTEGAYQFLQDVGKELSDPELLDPNAPLPAPYVAESATPKERTYWPFQNTSIGTFEPTLIDPTQFQPRPDLLSRRFTVPGSQENALAIGGINGINTTFEEAQGHALYLQSFTPDQGIDWVYNQTHGVGFDLAESVGLNYRGVSITTKELLIDSWTEFHMKNIDNPDAKYLQFCHSQGTIHVYNALAASSPEIRDRVIVVAIAPAKTVTNDLCYQSYNYASDKDIVHYGELVTASRLADVFADRQELIILEADPKAEGIDHNFQSPTFYDVIKRHIINHYENNGEYK